MLNSDKLKIDNMIVYDNIYIVDKETTEGRRPCAISSGIFG